MAGKFRLQRIRDPLYNIIEFKENEHDNLLWKLIQTNEFQRLRRIKQLGFSEFVYPGATHTRFAHSLGVCHLAHRLVNIIDDKLCKQNSDSTNSNKKLAALCAALLHDVGHGPFSHAFEDVGKRLELKSINHEYVTERLIRDGEIGQVLEKYSTGFSNEVAVAVGEHSDIYSSVVSGQFDADRLDYMQRDRIMTGTNIGTVDLEWLLSNIEISEVEFTSDDEELYKADAFVLGPKGLLAAEAYALNLFQLYPTIYYHKTTRCAEKIFSELFFRVISKLLADGPLGLGLAQNSPIYIFADKIGSWDASMGLDDTVIWGSLPQLIQSSDKDISNLAERLYQRKLFKAIKLPIKETIINNTNAKFTDESGKISLLMESYYELSAKVEEWNNDKSNINDKIFLDFVHRKAYINPITERNRSNQILAINGDKVVSLTDISKVVKNIGPFIDIRAYVSEYNNKADEFLCKTIKKIIE